MYRLLVTDVDGTLLDSCSRLPEENKKAVFRCHDRGIGVVLATGKTIYGIRGLVKELEIKLPQITIHGAVSYDAKENILDASTIRPDLYFEVIKTIKQRGHPVFTATPDGILYCDKKNTRSRIMEDIGEKIVMVKSLETEELANSSVCMSVLIEESDPLEGILRERFLKDLQLVRSGKFFFDLLNKDSTKGKALTKLTKDLGFNKEEIAAIGDSYNDLSLFEISGLKIAVSNACDKLIEKADVTVAGNDECGFAQAVREYIIQED